MRNLILHIILVVACVATAQTYTLTISTGIDTAEVSVSQAGLFGGAKQHATGSVVEFGLESGKYKYKVAAPHHLDFRGEFSVPENKHLSVYLTPDYLEAGNSIRIGDWVMQAGWGNRRIVFRTTLGDRFFNITADKGYSFALVPIAIQNDAMRTESLIFATWKLFDDNGYEYSTQTMADMYLNDSEILSVSDVPPGSERAGYLVFQVRQDAKTFYLKFEGFRFSGTWRFSQD